jgi:hypothetical protein
MRAFDVSQITSRKRSSRSHQTDEDAVAFLTSEPIPLALSPAMEREGTEV